MLGCCRYCRNNTGASGDAPLLGLHGFSLTFKDARTEREYTRGALDGLRTWVSVSSMITVTLMFAHFLLIFFRHWGDESFHSYYLLKAGLYAPLAVLMLFNIAVSQYCCRFVSRMDFALLEVYVVSNILAVLLVVVADVMLVSVDANRAHLILLIITATMTVHLNPQIRWHMMIPVQVSAIAAYALPAFLTSGPESVGTRITFLTELVGLVGLASCGKRMIQVREKQIFLNLIAERTSRVHSEFQLSQMRDQGPRPPPEDLRSSVESVPDSVPTTTETGRVFRIAQQDGGGELLEGIQEVGQREQWLVDLTMLSWGGPDDIIGVGGFGIVVRGRYQDIDVAVKVPKATPHATRNRSSLIGLCNELQILRRVRHPNIVGFFGACLDERHNDLALVLELVDGRSLRSFVDSAPDNSDKAQVLSQISCAVRYLHMQHPRIVHGDLKDTNTLVARQGPNKVVTKLLDFGLARRITKNSKPMGASLLWAAPEVVQGSGGLATAVDVFSFGRVAYFVLSGIVPGEGRRRAWLKMDLLTGVVPPLRWPTDEFAHEYRPMVESCSWASPALRPDISEVHHTTMRIRETTMGLSPSGQKELGDLHTELRALRSASRDWKPRDFKSKADDFPLGVRGGGGGSAACAAAASSQSQWSRRAGLAVTPEESTGQSPAGADCGPASSPCTCPSRATRLFPKLELTPLLTQMNMMAPALARCNIEVPVDACCTFHAAARQLKAALKNIAAKPCRAIPTCYVGQCNQCSAVMTSDDISSWSGDQEMDQEVECPVCGENVPVSLAASVRDHCD